MKTKKGKLYIFTAVTVMSLLTASVVPASETDNTKIQEELKEGIKEGVKEEAKEELKEGLINGYYGAETDDCRREYVFIKTAEEFMDIVSECRVASYSQGKVFVLEGDIDLSGKKDTAIPYMDGVFDGNNRKITGVFEKDDISDSGLFRYIGEHGVVKDLKVEAGIVGGEDTENIGIICGNNSGVIKDCESIGSIDAYTSVGGICGINNESGIIRNCKNQAIVNSRFSAGGICGLNKGYITDCENYGIINKNEKVKKGSLDGDGKTVNISIPNAVAGLTADSRSNQSGGIAGYNKGILEYCVNNGTVGNRGLGNSSGGIAGKMSDRAVMTGCLNNANIYGAEGIGGIVGVLEPYEITQRGKRYRDELSDELNQLKNDVDALKNETVKLGDNFSENIDLLSDEFKGLRDTVNDYADGFDSDISYSRGYLKDQADALKDHIHDIDLDLKLGEVADSVESIRSNMRGMSACIEEIEETAKGLSGEKKKTLLSVAGAYKTMLSQIAGQLSALNGSSEEISALVKDIVSSFGSGGSSKDIEKSLGILKDIPEDVKKKAGESLEDIAFLAKASQDELDNITDIMVSWPEEGKKLHHALKNARDDMEEMYDTSDDLLDKIDVRGDALRSELRERGNSVSDTADAARDRLNTDRKAVSARIDDVKERMWAVRDTIDNFFDDIEEVIREKSIYRDVSVEMGSDCLFGQISGCTNNGEVYAKKCAGGIAGEVNTDMVRERTVDNVMHLGQDILDFCDDESDDDDDEIKPVIRYVQAKIESCSSKADIHSSDGYTGGIAGRAAYGVIDSCEAYGDFSSDDGKYVGGIAGFSNSLISDSYALCGLYGNSYVGGIAGRGRDIKNCSVMSYMDMDSKTLKSTGAVAGFVKGELSGNIYVDNGHGAVDGVTDFSSCRGLDYSEFIKQPVPGDFTAFSVKFMDGERVIWTRECKYGEEIKKEDYPRLVPAVGQYVYWEDKDIPVINRNITVHSVRRYYVPSVSGKTAANKTVKPDLVIAGNFYPDTVLLVDNPSDVETKKIQEVKKQLVPDIHYVYDFAYHYRILQDEPFYNTMEFRVLNKSLMANQIVLLDDDMNPITELKDVSNANSYLSLRAAAPQSGYLIIITYVSKITVAAVTVSVIVIIAVVIILGVLFFRLKNNWKNRDGEHYNEAAIRKSTMEFLSGFLSEDLIRASKKALDEMHRQNQKEIKSGQKEDGVAADDPLNSSENGGQT